MEGKAYLVTGACGGLGSAVTGALARQGAHLFAVDIDRKALLEYREDRAVSAHFVDVADPDTMSGLRAEIEASGTMLDGIVCAAGVYVGGPLLAADVQDYRRAFEINVLGAAAIVREFFPSLRRGARIVLVSSESTRVALPFTGPYAISKRALETYADTLRRELLPLGIHVTVIQPGAIKTALLETAARSLHPVAPHPAYRRGLSSAAAVLAKTAKKGLEPERVAAAIARILAGRRPVRLKRMGNDRARALLSLLPSPLIDRLVRRFL
ncbi:SDR family NAD(P)-dependent oxidoreductase [Salinispira pacifica]